MKIRKLYFSMVEVTLAIAIIGFGIGGVMALFPVGLNANTAAVGDNYSAMTIDEIIRIIEYKCKLDFNEVFNPADPKYLVPSAPPTIDAGLKAIIKNVGDWNNSSYDFDISFPHIRKLGAGVLGIMQENDFYGVVRIWKENPTPVPLYANNEWKQFDLGSTKLAKICIEIIWPAQRIEGNHEKRYYYFEINNPI